MKREGEGASYAVDILQDTLLYTVTCLHFDQEDFDQEDGRNRKLYHCLHNIKIYHSLGPATLLRALS